MSIPPVIEWRDGAVRILDQRRLPDAVEVLHCTDVVEIPFLIIYLSSSLLE